ncbi:MAG TPA: 3'-5' exonuclease, partial [Kofleriaceae bacterium]|nr:3'-5' exonuclease [Kofleriaceae bacterium]
LWDDRSIEFQALVPKFDYEAHGSEPRTELWLVQQVKVKDAEGKEKLERADDVREREGVALAAWIRDTVEGDKPLTIYDRERRAYRRARYGDIAILSGTRTPFPAYERALADLGIPFVKDGGREFFRGREVLDLLAALRVIDNPLDDMSLLAALRSPLFGWGDRDLVRVRVAAGERALWYGLSAVVPNDATASPDAYDTIARLRRHATLVPPVALIEMICDATAYRAALLSLPRGRAQVANIDQLIEFARATAKLDGPSLSSFVHRATLAERYLGTHREAPLNVAGDDAVVISTVHGAKGLEWPVVLLAGLDGDLVRANAAARYSAPDGALIVGFKVDDDTTLRSAGNAAIVDAAKAREEAEARRLLYVAMTRARERLILTSKYKYEESKSSRPGLTVPIKWLASELAIEESDVETEVVSYRSARVSVRHLTPDRITPMRNAAAAFQDARLAAARQAVRDGAQVDWDAPSERDGDAVATAVGRALSIETPTWASQTAIAQTTVTQLVYFFRCPLVYYFDLVLQMDENPRGRGKAAVKERRMTALDRGTHVHELLERADLTEVPEAEARRLTGQLTKRIRNLASDESARIEKLVGAVLSDPLMDRARAATLIEREYPFYLKLGDTMVQGVIDLVFRDAKGNGVVVDYKSNDLAAPGRLATLMELYRPQIELYSLAVKQAGLVEPNEATLYFLNGPTPVSTPIDERRLEVVE